jgi:hypothetical protein
MRWAFPTMQKALLVGQLLVGGVFILSVSSRYSFVNTSAFHLSVRIFAYGLAAFMYGLQALFFQYGELRDESDLTVP